MAREKHFTNTEIKRRYNNKVYARVHVELQKELVAEFKAKCTETGISQASVFREAMEKFIAEH